MSSHMLDHAVSRACFRTAVLLCGAAHTSASRMDQIAKSIGFKSGLEGCHMSLSQNPWKLLLHHCWVNFDVCDGALSWIKTYPLEHDPLA